MGGEGRSIAYGLHGQRGFCVDGFAVASMQVAIEELAISLPLSKSDSYTADDSLGSTNIVSTIVPRGKSRLRMRSVVQYIWSLNIDTLKQVGYTESLSCYLSSGSCYGMYV